MIYIQNNKLNEHLIIIIIIIDKLQIHVQWVKIHLFLPKLFVTKSDQEWPITEF